MKIQYYASDLSYALGIGEIADMHVETLASGVQVLRIDCLEKKQDEYQTVKTRPKTTKNQVKPRKPSGKGITCGNGPAKPLDNTLGGKLMDLGKKFMSNKEKPNFMRDAGF
jgi:hypothetical protein